MLLFLNYLNWFPVILNHYFTWDAWFYEFFKFLFWLKLRHKSNMRQLLLSVYHVFPICMSVHRISVLSEDSWHPLPFLIGQRLCVLTRERDREREKSTPQWGTGMRQPLLPFCSLSGFGTWMQCDFQDTRAGIWTVFALYNPAPLAPRPWDQPVTF